jgi:preprotein translocase subunit SecD
MTTLRDMLIDADPLRLEQALPPAVRQRARQIVVDAARPAEPRTPRVSTLAALIALVVLTLGAGGLLWPRAAVELAAAIRFEVRLAEESPAPGLTEATRPGSDRQIYLHPDTVVDNGDILQARVTRSETGRFGVALTFTADGAAKLLRATEGHVGRPLALLLDGQVVAVPVVRSPMSESAEISGRYSRAEAERIATGVQGS